MSTSRRSLLQALVWTLYTAASLGMARPVVPLTSGVVAIFVMLGAGLWAASEALRASARRGAWLDLRPAALALRGLGLPLLLAVLIQAVVFGVTRLLVGAGLVTLPPDAGPLPLAVWAGYVANTAILLWLWLGLWGGLQYLRRWRDGEVRHWQAEAARRALALEVLRAQVNPHFIFNALNNVRALISEDPARARDALTRLSHTLRHTLTHSARELVPLGEELAIARDYIALEQLHFEDRLRLRWQIEPGLDERPVPPMVLQLLIENAIKHGIARTPGGGEVEVTIARNGAGLRIAVTNPGRWAPGPAPGLGLVHLRERLALSGGPGADCRTEDLGGRVRVSVVLAVPAMAGPPATAAGSTAQPAWAR